MDTKRINEIRERAEKATAGPWRACFAPKGNLRHDVWVEVDTDDDSWDTLTDNEYEERCGVICDLQSALRKPCLDCKNPYADAQFIAHSRQDIPDLLAYIAELELHSGEQQAKTMPDAASLTRLLCTPRTWVRQPGED